MNSNLKQQNTLNEQGLTRRKMLFGLLASVGGVSTFASATGLEKAIATSSLQAVAGLTELGFYTAQEFALTRRLADLIIPDTQTLGALAVGVPESMDRLHTEWASKASQTAHRNALKTVKNELDTLAGQAFVSLSNDAQLKVLNRLDQLAFSTDYQRLHAYRSVKDLIARFYYLSEVGASQELRYELVPGRWESCIPFEKVGRTWAV